MAHKFVLLIISLCVSSQVRGQLPDLNSLNIQSKQTTTTPPPEPDPILTGAARTASDRVTPDLPSDIIFNDGTAGGSATNAGSADQVINLDLERLITETLGGMGDPGAPRSTDMTSLLDLMNTDPISSSSPSQNEAQKLPDFFSLQPPTLPNLPASSSNTDTSVGIPMSLQESNRVASSQKKSAPTITIPENPTPPELPPLPSFSELPPLPSPPELPPLPRVQTETPSSPLSQTPDLPPLSQTPDLPPLSLTDNSLTETPSLPSLSDTPQLPPQNPQSPSSGFSFPNLPTSGRQPLDQRPGLPPFNPQSPFARRPPQGFQGPTGSPFSSNLPSGSGPMGLGPMRRRNPLQAASQLLERMNNRGPIVPPSGPENSGPIDPNTASDGPSADPNLLPFAENVLTQVQQLVDRLKENGDGRPAGRRGSQRGSGPTPDCPNGRPVCPDNPCETSACLNIINAQCRPSCTECAPRYFVNDREVTDTCTIISGLRPNGGIANIDPTEQGAHLFMGTNGEFLNIPNRGRPSQGRGGPRSPTQRPQTPLIDPLTRQPIDPRFIEQLESRRMRDPRLEQGFPGDFRGLPSQFAPGAPNMDPRFLRALAENENQARISNTPNGLPFDPRIRQFMRPGAPPVDLQQIARAQGQNLDMDAVRRFIAERGLQGTVNLGEPDASPARTRFANRINEFRRRAMANRFPPQGLPNGINALPLQGRAPGSPAARQRPNNAVNQQDLQRLQTDFAAFQAGPRNTPPQTGIQLPNTPNLQTAQNNPLGTIQAAMRQFQRQATFRAGRPSPGRQISNVI